jgi:hypothetical protein
VIARSLRHPQSLVENSVVRYYVCLIALVKLQIDEVPPALGRSDNPVEDGAPVSRPVNHRRLAELARLKRKNDPAPNVQGFGCLQSDEISAAGGRTHQDAHTLLQKQALHAFPDLPCISERKYRI